MTAAEKILEALKLVIGKDVNEFAIPVINTIIKAHESEEKVSLREDIERLKTAIESFNRSEYNLRESIGQLQEQVKERYKIGYRDGYSQGKSDGID